MTVLRINIMAHASRRALWEPLQSHLTGAQVYEDDGTLGRWGNGRRCLLNYGPDDTHVLVIQDDALPASHLIEGLEHWLPRLPDSILCLYSGKLGQWRKIHDKFAQPPCWLQMAQIQWGVALVVPTKYIPAMVKKADSFTRIGNYDMRLSEGNMRTNKLPVLYPSPSWVQHAYAESTVPGRKPNRHALHALTQDQSVLDWALQGEAPIIRVPDFSRRPAGQQFYRGAR